MRRLILFLAVIILAPQAAAQLADAALTGRFVGSGRACHGTLAINAKTVLWKTTFSRCQGNSADIMERGDSGGVLRVTYRLAGTAKSCRFAAVSLSHDETKRHDSDWQIVGYGSEQRFLEDKASGYTMNAPDMMFCTVVREHQAPPVSW